MRHAVRAWAMGLAVLCALGPTASLAAAPPPPVTLLITHPRPSVLRHYIALVKEHVLNVQGLQIVGIYHASETEDYQESAAYLAHEHVSWITLHAVQCPLSEADVFRNNACRGEFEHLFKMSQGMVFNGGPDIPPSLYGEPTLLMSRIDTPKRSTFEVALLVSLLGSPRAPGVAPLIAQRPSYPILGICMGMQAINVANGGTLVQDIPSELYGIHTVEEGLRSDPASWHRSYIPDDPALAGMAPGVFHPVRVRNNAPEALHAPPESLPQVLSIHHQAVGRVGPDYVVYATSVDGKVIEAIGSKKYVNVLGVQWHPERAPLWDPEAVESFSPYTVSINGPNMAYNTLAHDPTSRAFLAEVWVWLSRAMQRTASVVHT